MRVENIISRLLGASGAADAQIGSANLLGLSLPFGDIQSAWFDSMIDTAQRSILF